MPTDEERVAADPALLAETRRRYTGRGDVRDHLWWLRHPGAPTPEGVPDPASAVAASRHHLYRRDGGDRAAVLAEAAAVEEDRALARRAVADVLAAQPARPDGGTGPTRAVAVSTLAGGLAAALVGGAIAGALITRATAAPAAPLPSALVTPQRDADRIDAVARPAFVDPRSTRLLRNLSDAGTSLYGARDTGGAVCLVAVVLATRSATTCAPEPVFRADGLRLAVQATADPVDDAGTTPAVDLQVRWEPDGRVLLGAPGAGSQAAR